MAKKRKISFDLIIIIGMVLGISLMLLGWIFPKVHLFLINYPLILFSIPITLLLLAVFGSLNQINNKK
jgi:hypothetical protein